MLLLQGDLGAGKTTLARGFIREKCDDNTMRVTSPSYLLDNLYEFGESSSPHFLHHIDLFRLPPACDLSFLSIPSIFDTSLCLIEWPERLQKAQYPKQFLELRIQISDTAQQTRTVLISAVGAKWKPRLQALQGALSF
jgi:tRNA threonylcarbamoyladenosine biosynthesis protein TsaE